MNESDLPESPLPFPSAKQALGLLLLYALVDGGITLVGLVSPRGWQGGSLSGLSLLGQILGLGVILAVSRRWGRRGWREFLPLRRVETGIWLALLPAVIGLVLVMNGLDGLVDHFIPEPESLRPLIRQIGWPSVVLGGPIAEESIFRGVILGGFLGRYSRSQAIWGSAILFTLMHGNPWQFLPPLMIGLFLGVITAETGSLWPALAVHIFNNLSWTVADSLHLALLGSGAMQPLWMWLLGLTFSGVGLLALIRRFRRNGEEPESSA